MKSNIFKHLALLASLALLSACVSMAELSRGLDSLVGQDIKVAFKRLGYPDNKQSYGEDTVYVWERTESVPSSGPMFGVGAGGGHGFGGIAFGGNSSATERCRIKLVARADKILSHETDGSYSACKPYQDRLKMS